MPKIDLKCPNCGAECHWIKEADTKVCLHCGYQETYTDADAVKIERIRSTTKLKEQRLSFLSKHFSTIILVGLMLLSMIVLGIMAFMNH